MHRTVIFGAVVLAGCLSLSGAAATPAGATAAAGAGQDPPRLRAGQVVRLEGRLEDSDPAAGDGSRFDTFLIDCDAGQLDVRLRSTQFDAYLAVQRLDQAGSIAWTEEDDDGGEGTNSRVRREIRTRSRLRIIANGLDAASRGAFALELRLTGTAPADVRDARLRNASASNQRGVALHRAGRTREALPFVESALTIRRQLLGDEHPDTLESLNNQGFLLQSLGRLAEAEAPYLEALIARRRVLGDEHPDTLTSINNYGALLEALGRATEAEQHLRDALATSRRTLGDDHPDTLVALSNYGFLLGSLGRAAESEPFVREALTTRRRVLGDEHPDTLDSINNYGMLLLSLGRAAEAEPYSREAMDVSRRVLGDAAPSTLDAIGNHALMLLANGRSMEAEPFAREVLGQRRRGQGREHPDTLRSLSNYAYLLLLLDRAAEAEPLYREAVAVRRRILGDEHPGTLRALGNHAVTLQVLGRLDEAEPLFRTVMEATRRVLGPEHPNALVALGHGAMLLEATGRPDDARVLWLEYLSGAERLRSTAPGDEQGRSAAAEDLNVQLASVRAARLALRSGDPAAAFDLLERGRGRTLLDLIARSDEQVVKVLGRASPLAAAAHEQARAAEAAARDRVRALEAAAGLAARRGDDAGRRELEAKAIEARSDLGLATFATFELVHEHLPATAPATAASVQSRLEPGTVLLSISLAGEVAVVVGLSHETVVGAEGTGGQDLASELGALRDAAADGGAIDEAAVARRFAAHQTPELRALIDAAERLVILPSPSVAGIPFELVLPGTPISYASSASVWFDRGDAAAARPPGSGGTLVAVGDPDFSGRMDPNGGPTNPADRARVDALRSAGREQLRAYGGTLSPLPGTRAEVRTIGAVAEASGVDVRALLGRTAAVPALRDLVRGTSPRYLHLATHGFAGTAARPYTASLALSAPVVPAAGDTGFLTLDDLIGEWAGLLERTDLVVLSACDTAVGVARGGSDMALPWGFYFAGAPTVICSLWEVDDTATALLMGRLYENLLGGQAEARSVWGRRFEAGEPMSKADALDEAKAWLRGLDRDAARAALDSIGLTDQPLPRGLGLGPAAEPVEPAPGGTSAGHPYAHPRFWAAFTLRGSPE